MEEEFGHSETLPGRRSCTSFGFLTQVTPHSTDEMREQRESIGLVLFLSSFFLNILLQSSLVLNNFGHISETETWSRPETDGEIPRLCYPFVFVLGHHIFVAGGQTTGPFLSLCPEFFVLDTSKAPCLCSWRSTINIAGVRVVLYLIC